MTANIQRNSQSNLFSFITSPPKKILRPLVALAFLLTLWQVLCSSPDSTIPAPLTILQETWDPLIKDPFYDNGGTDRGLFWQVLASIQRVSVGFFLAAVVGISLGVLIGTNSFMYDALDPIFQVLRTIPPLAWLPISLTILRQADPSAIFVIFITAIWPIIINTTVGVQQIPQDYRNVSKVLQLSKTEYFFNILIPSAVPYIFTGLRIAIGLSWLAIVAAEMLVGGVGIGFFIWDNYNSGMLSPLIIGILYVGIIGLVLDRLVGFIADLVVPPEQK
jgi:nitrate/nitrite transport system permease protein